MSNLALVLAIDSQGNEITVATINGWLANKSKKELADFIYYRLHGKYLKPFEYEGVDFKKNFKNGFSIMANCCLLIETYVSFIRSEFKTTHGKSEKAFGYFFTTDPGFAAFGYDGQTPAHYLSNAKLVKSGIPHDFYSNVRCGILHSGETKNGWKINRSSTKAILDPGTKDINAIEFAKALKQVIENYQTALINANFDTDDLWICFKARLSDVISKA